MVFVESGERAIAEIELRPFDVVISDMRMPGMDGAALLKIVAERWPHTIRIVLSGYAEEEQSARLLSVAHQYVSKPCDAQEIEALIDRCMQLHNVLADDRLRTVVGRIKRLPAMPATYAKLREAMSRPDTSAKQIAAIIYEDPPIAARVLQVVNSAFFRLARRIANIEQAVSYLGFTAIRNLVMSAEVFASWTVGSGPPGLEPERLQARAHKVAAAAQKLAGRGSAADDALLAGLFHNIGYWVLLVECKEDLQRALDIARSQGIPMYEAERQIIGASHAEIGAYLLGLWGLPYSVIEAVAFQYRTAQVQQAHFDVLAALVTAEVLIAADTPLVPGVPDRTEPIGEDYLQKLKAPFDWQEARSLALTEDTE
jgi:HD-like signal output (HDOD) protein